MDTATLLIVATVVLIVIVGLVVWWGRPSRLAAPGEPTAPRFNLGPAIRRVLGPGIDDGTWDGVEETLLAADLGVAATTDLITSLKRDRPDSFDRVRAALRDGLSHELAGKDRSLDLKGSPAVVIVVGVNGTGKTTTIAKLAKRLLDSGLTVTLGAADTFRAAAGEQLRTLGNRIGVNVVVGQEGGDPAAVAHDTLSSARARGVDVAIIDTAGRLHGQQNLMAELAKIHRVAGGDEVSEVLLVLDGTAGQNGLAQVREFSSAVPLTGIVITKLDGTARGGIVISVERDLGVPVKYVGTGESLGDLMPFDPDSFVDSLLEGL